MSTLECGWSVLLEARLTVDGVDLLSSLTLPPCTQPCQPGPDVSASFLGGREMALLGHP